MKESGRYRQERYMEDTWKQKHVGTAGKTVSEQHQPWALLYSAWEPSHPSVVTVDAEAWGSKDCFFVIPPTVRLSSS